MFSADMDESCYLKIKAVVIVIDTSVRDFQRKIAVISS